jgi:alkylation response protein AidB-like acyl-CoA dehydrogenase
VDFSLGEHVEAFRAEVRGFLGEHLTGDIVERAHATGTMHDWSFHRALAERGWISASWPVELGGQGRDPLEMAVLMEELYGAGAPVDGLGIAMMVAHTLRLFGSDEQRADVLPRILRGDAIPCLGYSEPDAGSDVAAVATRAVRDGEEWVVDGQKVFTTLAHEAQYVFLLTRTNPDVAKHRGLTLFLVPMDTSGIEVHPIETLGGERTNMTFYSGVRVPDTCRVGDVDGGWSVMLAALAFERTTLNLGDPAMLIARVTDWAAGARDAGGRRRLDDPNVRARLVRATIDHHVGRLLAYRAAWVAAQGDLPQVEGSMAKLWVTEAFTRAAGDLHDLLGAEGLLQRGAPGAPAGGGIEHAFRHAQVTTIYGGSSEIQRGIIAEHGLGLPRTR